MAMARAAPAEGPRMCQWTEEGSAADSGPPGAARLAAPPFPGARGAQRFKARAGMGLAR